MTDQNTPESTAPAVDQSATLVQALVEALQQTRPAPSGPREEHKKFPEPETYEGKSMRDYREWIRTVDDYLEAKSTVYPTDKDKVQFASIRMKGNIRAAWSQYRESLDLNTFTFSEFKEFLRNQLENPKDRGLTAVMRFHRFSQYQNQSVREFEIAYRDMLRELEDQPHPESSYWAFTFFSKLRDPIKREVLHRGSVPTTIRDVATLAARVEELQTIDNRRNSKPRQDPEKPAHPSKPNTGTSHDKRPADAGEDKRDKSSNKRRKRDKDRKPKDKKDVRCYNCNEFGHYASACTNPKNPDASGLKDKKD